MGLDNGIIIRKNKTSEKLLLEERFRGEYDSEGLEIVYWRKNWGLRNYIVDYLCNKYLETNECTYHWNLDREDIEYILDTIRYFYNPAIWEDKGESIWTWEEIEDVLTDNIATLAYIHAKIKEYPDLDIYFYDSY